MATNRATFHFFFSLSTIVILLAKKPVWLKDQPPVRRNRQNGSDQIRTFGCYFSHSIVSPTRPE